MNGTIRRNKRRARIEAVRTALTREARNAVWDDAIAEDRLWERLRSPHPFHRHWSRRMAGK